MRKPIHKASLRDLLCIVQSGSGHLGPDGSWWKIFHFLSDDTVRITDDQAEAEIQRRFKALQRKIKRLEAER